MKTNFIFHFLHKSWLKVFILLFAFVLPFSISLYDVITGNIAFWYDPARDLLSALDNLHKITLIGPTSGIPGVFYGPYWIWFLSIGLLFSKNPRFVNFVVEMIPYYIIFPILLLKMKKYFGLTVIVLLWLLFMLSTGLNYTVMMWNPHTAPVLFLLNIFVLIKAFESPTKKFVYIFLSGMVSALTINFHISFGLGSLLGIFFYFFLSFLEGLHKNKKNVIHHLSQTLITFFVFGIGSLLIFLPTLFFEMRHGFHQIQALFTTFTKYGGVVHLNGLTKAEILYHFFGRISDILHIPFWVGLILITFGITFLLMAFIRKQLTSTDKAFVKLLSCFSFGILFIYLTAKNPVWEYHFIATEIIFLIFIGLVLRRLQLLTFVAFVWVLFISSVTLLNFRQTIFSNLYASPSLLTKEHIVSIIITDAKNQNYTAFDYSPSIYTFDYSYLFKWKANKDIPYDPSQLPKTSPVAYLIIPSSSPSVKNDFIEYRTPTTNYKTTSIWNIEDGTTIIKRLKISPTI